MTDLAKLTVGDSPITLMHCALDQLAAHSDPVVRKQAKQLRRNLDDILDRAGRALHLSMSQTEAVMREHDKHLAAMVEIGPQLPGLIARVAELSDDVAQAG